MRKIRSRILRTSSVCLWLGLFRCVIPTAEIATARTALGSARREEEDITRKRTEGRGRGDEPRLRRNFIFCPDRIKFLGDCGVDRKEGETQSQQRGGGEIRRRQRMTPRGGIRQTFYYTTCPTFGVRVLYGKKLMILFFKKWSSWRDPRME